jgi:hypothetical protein
MLSTLLMAAGILVEESRGKQVTELPSSPDGSTQTSRGLAKFPAGGFSGFTLTQLTAAQDSTISGTR